MQDLPQQGGYVVTPVTEIPALTKLVTSIALLGIMSVNSWGWKNLWHTVFTRPTHWFGRLFSHFMPNPDRLRKQVEHDMTAGASLLFAQQAPQVGRWLHGQAKVVEQATGTIMAMSEWTHDALVQLRHVTVPTLIHRAVVPLAQAINRLDARLTGVEDKISSATGYINTMLRTLPRGTGQTFDTAIRQWANAFGQLYNNWYDTWLPRIERLYNIRVPALERGFANLQEYDTYLRTQALPDIRGRLTKIEQALGGILTDPTTWLLGLLGAAMIPALGATGMRQALRNLTCRNTQTLAREVCSMDEDLLAQLLAGTLLFAIALDPREIARAGQVVTEGMAGLFQEIAIR